MMITHRTRIFLSLFLILLTFNLVFFLVIRNDLPVVYQELLQVLTTAITLLGIETSIEAVEAGVILVGFIVSTIAAAYLLYIGLRAIRTGTVLQDAVERHVSESAS
jgi:hypothetical protein